MGRLSYSRRGSLFQRCGLWAGGLQRRPKSLSAGSVAFQLVARLKPSAQTLLRKALPLALTTLCLPKRPGPAWQAPELLSWELVLAATESYAGFGTAVPQPCRVCWEFERPTLQRGARSRADALREAAKRYSSDPALHQYARAKLALQVLDANQQPLASPAVEGTGPVLCRPIPNPRQGQRASRLCGCSCVAQLLRARAPSSPCHSHGSLCPQFLTCFWDPTQ